MDFNTLVTIGSVVVMSQLITQVVALQNEYKPLETDTRVTDESSQSSQLFIHDIRPMWWTRVALLIAFLLILMWIAQEYWNRTKKAPPSQQFADPRYFRTDLMRRGVQQTR